MPTIDQIHILKTIATLIPQPTTLNPHQYTPYLRIDNTGLTISTFDNHVTIKDVKLLWDPKLIAHIHISDPELIPELTKSITQALTPCSQ